WVWFSITTQLLSLETGRDSWIETMSPTLHALVSSCALYFFERRTVFLNKGCVKRRSTRTTTVLSLLSLTTVPCKTRFGIFVLRPCCRPTSRPGLYGCALCRDELLAHAQFSRAVQSLSESAG